MKATEVEVTFLHHRCHGRYSAEDGCQPHDKGKAVKISVLFNHDDCCQCSCPLIKRSVFKSEGRKGDDERAENLG